MEKTQDKCKERVSDSSGWHHYQCKRTVWKDGYCKQHHPDSVKERRRISDEKYEKRLKDSPIYRLIECTKKCQELEKRVAELEQENAYLKTKLETEDI